MLEGLQPIKRHYPCPVKELIDTLDETDKTILQEALDNEKRWTAYALHAALKPRGAVIHDKAIRKHRTGDCSC